MKALVTGASGFVGSYIVDACLARGDEVRALVRDSSDQSYLRELARTASTLELVSGDLTSPESLRRAAHGVDVVYHAAARVTDSGSRDAFMEANVTGTRHLLDAAREGGARRFVFVSSPSVVTDQKDQIDIDESYPYPARFVNFYSETKALAEQFVLKASTEGFTTCAIRPRGVWGPRDRTGFLPKIVAKLQAGKLADLSGGRKVEASLCYCENVAEACVLAARSDGVSGKAYFITDGEKTDVWAFAATLAELFNLPPITRKVSPRLAMGLAGVVEAVWQIPWLHRNHSPPISRYAVGLLTLSGTYDIGAARRDLGYRPVVEPREGLARLKAWVDAIGGVAEFTRFVR